MLSQVKIQEPVTAYNSNRATAICRYSSSLQAMLPSLTHGAAAAHEDADHKHDAAMLERKVRDSFRERIGYVKDCIEDCGS